jgi:hypothetical protein
MTVIEPEAGAAKSPEYEAARKRVETRRKFHGDLVAYLVINAFRIGVWAVTGAGYFWPGGCSPDGGCCSAWTAGTPTCATR